LAEKTAIQHIFLRRIFDTFVKHIIDSSFEGPDTIYFEEKFEISTPKKTKWLFLAKKSANSET